jgi:hypothetical protein
MIGGTIWSVVGKNPGLYGVVVSLGIVLLLRLFVFKRPKWLSTRRLSGSLSELIGHVLSRGDSNYDSYGANDDTSSTSSSTSSYDDDDAEGIVQWQEREKLHQPEEWEQHKEWDRKYEERQARRRGDYDDD